MNHKDEQAILEQPYANEDTNSYYEYLKGFYIELDLESAAQDVLSGLYNHGIDDDVTNKIVGLLSESEYCSDSALEIGQMLKYIVEKLAVKNAKIAAESHRQ